MEGCQRGLLGQPGKLWSRSWPVGSNPAPSAIFPIWRNGWRRWLISTRLGVRVPLSGQTVTWMNGLVTTLIPWVLLHNVGSNPTVTTNGEYTLRLIPGRKVNWLHAGSIPPSPTIYRENIYHVYYYSRGELKKFKKYFFISIFFSILAIEINF